LLDISIIKHCLLRKIFDGLSDVLAKMAESE
jgi:hypothetical protein